jgi:ribokinase
MAVAALVVGSLVQDLAFKIPRRPQPGEVVVATDFGSFRGGKGYNQAVALARLGAEVAMAGAVGHDAYGDAFLQAMRREGVEASRVLQMRGVPTALAVPMVTPDGDVAFVQYQGANRLLSPAHCADLPDCDVLLLQGEVPPAVNERAARVIRRRGGMVLLNPAPPDDVSAEVLEQATVVCPNEHEARVLLGRDAGEGVELAKALATEERAAVVTLGARGAAWADAAGSGEVAPPSVKAVDATGAGDSFCAALAVALGEGHPLPEAVRWACAAGAHAVTVSGAEPGLPTRAQMEKLLQTI